MFTQSDRAMIKALQKILDDATFPLKKREVAAFAQVMNWVVELEKRMIEQGQGREIRKDPKRKTKTPRKKISKAVKEAAK